MATLNFKGKTFVQNYHLSVKYHQLVSKKDKSLTNKISLNDNLIIHGDNLLALKALLPTYAGKVKVVCIDPPYNTGNEQWVYNDNVNSPMMKEWLGKVVDKEDLTRHDKWLCMMTPRLKLLRELLRDDGLICINIENNEVHQLMMLMDEIFQGNFVGNLIWRKKEGGGQTDQYFVTEHKYILVYAKSPSSQWIDETIPIDEAQFNKDDENGKFDAVKLAKWGSGARRQDRPSMYFPIKSPDGKNIYPKAPDGSEGRWRVGKIRMDNLIDNDFIYWEKKKGEWIPYENIYYQEEAVKKIKERSILYELANTGDATKMLTNIFGKKEVFENAKPIELVKFLISHTTDKNSIILDSFAGSGTTAHAVLDLNKEDGGHRKFILVESEDYADKITAERVRRVIKGIPNSKLKIQKVGANGHSPLQKRSKNFIGETKDYEVYLYYEPDIEKLKKLAFTLEEAKKLGAYKGKKRLVFAPTKYLDLNDAELIERHGLKGIEYCQLPFEIYKMKG